MVEAISPCDVAEDVAGEDQVCWNQYAGGMEAHRQVSRTLEKMEPRFIGIAHTEGDHRMYTIIRPAELAPSPRGTVTFEGEAHGSGVSFFLVNNEPGDGPDLHRHPYSETWIVRSGKALMTADGEDLEATAGDIVVVGGDTPHKFKNVRTDRLEIVCIHASPRMIQESLDE